MGMCIRIIVLLLALSIAFFYKQYYNLNRPETLPQFNTNEYWGRGEPSVNQALQKPQSQKITYGKKIIQKLQTRLNETLFIHDTLEGIGFEYGVNSKKVQEFVAYWRDDYLPRWQERESFLNTLPHYFIEVQGLNLHYIHTKPASNIKGKTVVPLLLLHGWPGSVREFYDIIPKLILPNDELNVVFEVITPSLPGYGWSQGAAKPGFGVAEMSIVLRNLMVKLGFNKFYIQGGDWGAALGSHIATIFPENVLGYHSNMCVIQSPLSLLKGLIAGFYPSYFIEKKYEDFVFPLSHHFSNLILETGYMHIQGTKPDTIGMVLSNNPVGLAVYILEKFSTWTNPNYRSLEDGGFSVNEISTDSILDNIMIYYLTNSITTSVRLYAETLTTKQMNYNLERIPTNVPTGCARFKHDLLHSLDWQLQEKYTNLIQSTYHEHGGHFAAMQLPEILYTDFIAFVKKNQK